MRVGIGHDARARDSDRPLILGGVELSGREGLAGPGAGDPVSRALADALIGAAGLDRAELPAPAEEKRAGPPSLALLSRAVRAVEGENYQVVNVDLSLLADAPLSAEHAESMRERLADRLHVSPDHVSVKRSGAGGRDRLGAGGDVAAVAVVLLDRIESVDSMHAALRAGG